MARHLDHLQEEEGGRGCWQLLTLSQDWTQTCRVTVRACMVVTWLAYVWPCSRTGKQVLVMCQDHTSPMEETPNFGQKTHGVTPQERGWNRGLPAGLVKGCTIHPECKNKQCWSTQQMILLLFFFCKLFFSVQRQSLATVIREAKEPQPLWQSLQENEKSTRTIKAGEKLSCLVQPEHPSPVLPESCRALIFSSKGKTGKTKVPTRTVKDFVANDEILDNGLRGKEGTSVLNNIFQTALVSPFHFMSPGASICCLDISCWQPKLEKES